MDSICKSNAVMMTGVYRSRTEFALQLLQGHEEINCSMYYINAFRYIENIKYNSINISEAINKINKYTSLRYNINLPEKKIINNLNKYRPVGLFSRSDIYHAIMYTLYLENSNCDTWIEKTQLNWTKTYEFLENGKDRKVILIYRDPRAVLASFKNYTNAPSPAYLSSVFNSLSFFQTILALMSSEKIYQNIFLAKYEDIVKDPKKYRKNIFSFLGKEYIEIDQKLWKDYDGSKWTSNTTQDTELIINNPSILVDSWKQRLTDDEILFCQSILGNYMKLFGYELSPSNSHNSNLINSLEKHHLTYQMYKNFLTKGVGCEAFPSDPFNSSTWEE